jgi:hypothetical protein
MTDKVEALRLNIEKSKDVAHGVVLLAQGIAQMVREAKGEAEVDGALAAIDDAAVPLSAAVIANTDAAPQQPGPPVEPRHEGGAHPQQGQGQGQSKKP